MSFSIEFQEPSIGLLSPPQIDSFSFVSSIYKMYAGAKFIVKDFSRALNNKLKTGMKVTVSFFDTEEKFEVKNNMSVLSFSKTGSSNIIDFIQITLVSSMYFEDTMNSIAREGNVGQLINNILTTEFKDSVPNVSIISTDDRVRRRYQLSEKSQDFLKRILKYGIKDNMPVYLYSAPDGTMYLKGIYDMITEQPLVALAPLQSDEVMASPEASDTLKERVVTSYGLESSGKNAISEMVSIFCTQNFKFSTNLDSYVDSTSIEKGNSQSFIDSPKKTKFFNWNYTPDDAKAIAVKEFFEETINTYTLVANLIGFPLKDIMIGSTVYFILPFDPTATSSTGAKINLGEGKYLITQVTLIYENKMESMSLVLSQIAS